MWAWVLHAHDSRCGKTAIDIMLPLGNMHARLRAHTHALLHTHAVFDWLSAWCLFVDT